MTDANTKPTIEQLQAMLAQFSAQDVKKLLTQAEKAKPTILSITMDTIVAHERAGDGALITDNVYTAVMARLAAAGMEKTQQSSVAALIRHSRAYKDAVERADKGPPVLLSDEDVSELKEELANGGETAPETAPAPEQPQDAPPAPPATDGAYTAPAAGKRGSK